MGTEKDCRDKGSKAIHQTNSTTKWRGAGDITLATERECKTKVGELREITGSFRVKNETTEMAIMGPSVSKAVIMGGIKRGENTTASITKEVWGSQDGRKNRAH